jgi:hypothetical protein
VLGSDANISLVLSSKGTGVVALGGTTAANSSLQVPTVASSVNYVTLQGGTAGNTINFSANGSDATIGINYFSKGGGGHLFNTNSGALQFYISPTASAVNRVEVTGAATGNAPQVIASGSDTNIGLVLNSKGTGVVAIGGTTAANSGFQVKPTTSAVNSLLASGSTAGNLIYTIAQGADANIGMVVQSKGSGFQYFLSGGGTQFLISHVGSAVNFIGVEGAATGVAPIVYAQGSDANINLKLTPKGTGTVQYGTYTATVLTPTGFITITDAGGTSRRLLVG